MATQTQTTATTPWQDMAARLVLAVALLVTAAPAVARSVLRDLEFDAATGPPETWVTAPGPGHMTVRYLNPVTVAPGKCGNGAIDAGEECDDANLDDTDGCTYACTVCGNGVVTAPEQCDDGNLLDHDGCNADCARCAPRPAAALWHPVRASAAPTLTVTRARKGTG